MSPKPPRPNHVDGAVTYLAGMPSMFLVPVTRSRLDVIPRSRILRHISRVVAMVAVAFESFFTSSAKSPLLSMRKASFEFPMGFRRYGQMGQHF